MGQVHNLSKEQLIGLSEKINDPKIGGFTVKSHGPKVGSSPSDVYLVGMAAHGQNDMPLPITENDISEFATSRGDVLSDPENYLGGFVSTQQKEKGKPPGSLDVSKAFPRSGGIALPMMQAYYGGKRPEESIGIYDKEGNYAGDTRTFNPIGMLYYHDED